MVPVAEPDSEEKRHSKIRRTDILEFWTSPIVTCSMLLVCVVLWGWYPNLFKPLFIDQPWWVAGPLIGPTDIGHTKNWLHENKAGQTNRFSNQIKSNVQWFWFVITMTLDASSSHCYSFPTYIVQKFWFLKIMILDKGSIYCLKFYSFPIFFFLKVNICCTHLYTQPAIMFQF